MWDARRLDGYCRPPEVAASAGLAAIFAAVLAGIFAAGPALAAPQSQRQTGAQAKARAKKDAPSAYSCLWPADKADTKRLGEVMDSLGFRPPASFRAVLTVIDLNGSGGIKKLRSYDWDGSAGNPSGWNPASTVKIFSAAAAIDFALQLGLPAHDPQVTVRGPQGPRSFSVAELIRKAIIKSDNIAHDRLTQLAGFDTLHAPDGMLRRVGLVHSAVMRAYQGKDWEAEGWSRSLRSSPPMTWVEGKRKREVAARPGDAPSRCGGAACTSLVELSQFMCMLMLYPKPAAKRLFVQAPTRLPPLLLELRKSLGTKRKTPDPVWNALHEAFGRGTSEPVLFKKGGFSEDWVSDNYFIKAFKNRRYLLAMSAYGGTAALDKAGVLLAQVMLHNMLDDKPSKGKKTRKGAQTGASADPAARR